jgi:hypothetical protein
VPFGKCSKEKVPHICCDPVTLDRVGPGVEGAHIVGEPLGDLGRDLDRLSLDGHNLGNKR